MVQLDGEETTPSNTYMRLRRSVKGSPHSEGPTLSHTLTYKIEQQKLYLFQSPKILFCELRLICAHNGLHSRWFITPIQGFLLLFFFLFLSSVFRLSSKCYFYMVSLFRDLFRNHFAGETLLLTILQVCTFFPYRNSIYCSISQFKDIGNEPIQL